LPVPFFGFRVIYEEIAMDEWAKTKGGLPPLEYADKAKIVSALAHPFATVGGVDVYPTVPAKAAALFRGLVKNHGLTDGNKRLAVTTMSAFLLANGWVPTYTNSQLYRYALRVARHRGNYPVAAIERWIRRHTRLTSDLNLAVLRAQNRRLLAREGIHELAFDASRNGAVTEDDAQDNSR
jgi:prophage maintenance system killer protein